MTATERQRRRLRVARLFPSRSFLEFFQTAAAGGVVLLACALVAIVWANSPWGASYERLWALQLSFGLGDFEITKSLQTWVKDALMSVFFLFVGLEIKRELLSGELASVRRAALPVAAALGGALVPAAIYTALNGGTAGENGWGIPMATDIAFALGVLSLVGGAKALLLRVFLTAVAIVDDLLAVIVIAVFYSGEISFIRLGVGAGFLAALIIANRLGIRKTVVFIMLGLGLWASFLDSGVHPTVAGVLLAMTIPAGQRNNPSDPDVVEQHTPHRSRDSSMLEYLEHALNPWVAFAIMPIFALANAGVVIEGSLADTLGDRIALGIVTGLIFGKQIGITLATWFIVRLGIAELPQGLTIGDVYSVSWLAGIGFTMSIFIGSLAFTDPDQVVVAKLGILAASAIAGFTGFLLLRISSRQPSTRRR